jgi:hypothetical protein
MLLILSSLSFISDMLSKHDIRSTSSKMASESLSNKLSESSTFFSLVLLYLVDFFSSSS